MERAAIVILNWNGAKMLKKYMKPLMENTNPLTGRVIVADNGSTDGSVEWLRAEWPQVELILFDRNYGFTGGYNRALRQVEAEYFILLNSDILVPDNWLDPLIAFMDSRPQVGICQPKMLSEARHQENSRRETGSGDLSGRYCSSLPEQFEYAGACGGFLDVCGFPFCRGRILSGIEDDRGQYDSPMQVFWASGACMVVRSEVWRKLDGLDESFFAHMEEIDFCWRAQLAGHEVWAVPQSHVYHVGGGTLPNDSPRKLFLNYRNNLLMLYKNLPLQDGWEAFGLRRFNRSFYIFLRMCIDGLTAVIYLLQLKPSFFMSVVKAHKAYRHMKKETAVTPQGHRRSVPSGIYPRSILVGKLLGRKIRFNRFRSSCRHSS